MAETQQVHCVELIAKDDMVLDHMRHTRADFEPLSIAFWLDSLEDDKVAVDVGAYTGLYSIAAKLRNPNIKSAAFEPNKEVAVRCAHNVAINGFNDLEIPVFECAIGDTRETVKLSTYRSGLTSAGTVAENHQKVHGTIIQEVPQETLDYVFADDVVSVIKIDVEGYEMNVLKGAYELISRCKPNIIAEANDEHHEQLLIVYMQETHGYKYMKADGRNILFTCQDREGFA